MHNIIKWWLIAAVVVVAGFIGNVQADENKVDSRDEIEATLDDKFSEGRYSRNGADGCIRCHDEESEKPAIGIFENVHGRLGAAHGPMSDRQCEACHGPVGNHARSPRKGQQREPMITFGSQSPVSSKRQNSVCLSCHADSKRGGWHSSTHAFEDLSCSSCHKVHQPKDPMLSQASQVETCTSCHSRLKADLHKRSSHPLLNGDMQCSNCHEPHQSVNEASLVRTTVNETCYDCHAEKRGPFLWEHEPVSEDCSYCHTPHGSINQALLDKRLPQLCQSCHRIPHAQVEIPEGDLKIRGGSCMNCHTQIHGTNHPRGLTLRR